MERVKGIEPSYAAWEAAVLPLNYTRWQELQFIVLRPILAPVVMRWYKIQCRLWKRNTAAEGVAPGNAVAALPDVIQLIAVGIYAADQIELAIMDSDTVGVAG